MSTFGGCNNGVQACNNGVNNCGADNFGTGSGSQNFGQGSGSNHGSGGTWTISPGAPGVGNILRPSCPCARRLVNEGPGTGAWNMGSASGYANHFNGQANIGCKRPC